jgi:hypothetical protein
MLRSRRPWSLRTWLIAGAASGLFALGGIVHPAAAQTGGEHISSYDVDIRIQGSGALQVKETIHYDFGVVPHHGIFRDIPVRSRYDDTYDRIRPIHVVSVRGSRGTPDGYSLENFTSGDTGYERIKIGDPDRTITGAHTYVISYTVDRAIDGYPDHDELYWNAIGTQWDVPIDEASVRVEAPARITQTACFAGPARSRLECGRSSVDGSMARFESFQLAPHDGLTVVLALPQGSVPTPPPLLEERWSLARAFSITPTTSAAAGGLLVLVIAGFGWLVWRNGRDRRFQGSAVDVLYGSPTGQEQSVPLLERDHPLVEFAPPENVRPGQVGTLIDEQANPLDVSATIVDLAVRGYLSIEEIPKEGFFGKPDWKLTKRKEADDLLPYERALVDGLFRDGDVVQLSELRTEFVERLHKVEDLLYEDVVKEGWYTMRPDEVRQRWRLIGFVALLLAIGILAAAIWFTKFALPALPLVVGGILLVAGVRFMPRRTAKGTAMRRRIEGFRIVIDTSEKELARFAEKNNIFSQFLPYAIVFGLTEKWARAFEQLGIQPDTSSWYASSIPFTYASFGYAIDGFSVATAGTIASQPASSGSSGFSGGGFSGGGGGGGGGGSW